MTRVAVAARSIGWRTPLVIILCGCLISLLGFGPRSAFGFFLTPMSQANGWGRDVFALAFALQNLLWGIGQPFAGAVQAAVMGELGGRVGVFPALAFSGVVAVVLGLALLLVARQSLRGLGDVARQPVWLWSGGALSVLIILAITVASPRIGLAATIGIIIAFNLIMLRREIKPVHSV